MAPRGKKLSTQELFDKLEAIVTQLENEEVDIDSALTHYKEGVLLAAELSERLQDISREIYVLKEKLDGSFSLNNFEETIAEDEYDE